MAPGYVLSSCAWRRLTLRWKSLGLSDPAVDATACRTLPLPDESRESAQTEYQRLRRVLSGGVYGTECRRATAPAALKIEAPVNERLPSRAASLANDVIVRQVRPTVINPDVAAGTFTKRDGGSNDHPYRLYMVRTGVR
jgi:hypothetical protein